MRWIIIPPLQCFLRIFNDMGKYKACNKKNENAMYSVIRIPALFTHTLGKLQGNIPKC